MTIDWGQASRFAGPLDSPGYLLWQVTHLWQRRINAALDALDLTQMQFVLLAGLGWLHRTHETVTQQMLSDFSRIERMQVSQVVRLLEKKGLIERQSHESDLRAKSLCLTPRGIARLEAALPVVEAEDTRFFDPDARPEMLSRLARLIAGR